MAHLFEPLALRDVHLNNRIVVSPMCEYSSENGLANQWHLVHLGSRAGGRSRAGLHRGGGCVPEGRISPQDLGVWSDAHAEALAPIVRFVRSQGSAAGIQLAHAGRKGSTKRPWDEGPERIEVRDGGWVPIAPSTIPFSPEYPSPREMSHDDIRVSPRNSQPRPGTRWMLASMSWNCTLPTATCCTNSFRRFSNHRHDEYGGSFANRTRFLLQVVAAVRRVWPEQLPLFVRISASDWTEGGWTIADSIELAKLLKAEESIS